MRRRLIMIDASEVLEFVPTLDPDNLPGGGRLSADQVLEALPPFDASRLAGHLDAAQSDALKRAGISRAAGNKTTPMHECCRWDNADALANFLTVKNCDRRDRVGFTPLQVAVVCNSPRCVELLLKKGADPVKSSPSGGTALHIAASVGLAVLKPIIRRCHTAGISLDHRDDAGCTALMRAISVRKEQTAYRLLLDGADARAATGEGLTPMDVARSHGFADMATLLEELG